MKRNYTFTNSAGETFAILAMNPLEQQIIRSQIIAEARRAGKPIEPPIYEKANAAGDIQRIQLTQRDHAPTPELEAAWDAYKTTQDEIDTEFGVRFQNAVFLSVEANPDEYPVWKKRMKVLGVGIPEDEFERLSMFCQTWVIRSKDDLPALIFAVTRTIMDLPEETLKAAEDMFRSRMEEALTPGADTETA
jgi:hypothetical protein